MADMVGNLAAENDRLRADLAEAVKLLREARDAIDTLDSDNGACDAAANHIEVFLSRQEASRG